MSGVIQLLPESTANQIAAGEVVQRPASVVKELLENSVDAGATRIKLFIKNGGSTHIQVDDNGKGMNAFDARMCWERHATSKIKKAEDLYNLNTLGFRGEALASIASVSQVEMKTKSEDENVGNRIVIDAGILETQENVAWTNGTSIIVRHLFYNIPARKNFLKSISVETKHIFDEYQRVALAYPSIAFEFYNQNKNVSKLSSGNLKTRISELFNIKEAELIAVDEETEIVNFKGFVGSPKLAKRTRGNQFLIANGRFIKDHYLNHAISTGYGGLLEEKHYPFYVLVLDVDPAKIDVNIHPTKHEVKLEDGRHVYTLLQSVVKKSLGTNVEVSPAQQITNATSSNQQSFQGTKPDNRFNPFSAPKSKIKSEWEKLDELLKVPIEETRQSSFNFPETVIKQERGFGECFQAENAFIITSIENELCIVNQYRAHAHILFHRYHTSQQIASQQLLFPRTVELESSDYNLYLEMQEEINRLGFDTSEFGKNAVIINGLPSELSKSDGVEVFTRILEDFKENFQDLKVEKKEALKRAAAKHAAIKAGTPLNQEEMKELMQDLLSCNDYSVNASGQSIVVKLDKNSLERFFQ